MEIERLVGADQWDSLYALGVRVASLIPNDSGFVSRWRNLTYPASIRTEPAGARVFRRPYDEADTSSLYLGTTPLDSARLPRFASRLRLELPGYRTQELVAFAFCKGSPSVTPAWPSAPSRWIPWGRLRRAWYGWRGSLYRKRG